MKAGRDRGATSRLGCTISDLILGAQEKILGGGVRAPPPCFAVPGWGLKIGQASVRRLVNRIALHRRESVSTVPIVQRKWLVFPIPVLRQLSFTHAAQLRECSEGLVDDV